MASSDFGRMLSFGAIRFEDKMECAVHMAGALASCRKALVGSGWTISHLVSTNRLRNHSPPLVGAPFSGLVGSIQPVGVRAAQTALTIESWLMSGCG